MKQLLGQIFVPALGDFFMKSQNFYKAFMSHISDLLQILYTDSFYGEKTNLKISHQFSNLF